MITLVLIVGLVLPGVSFADDVSALPYMPVPGKILDISAVKNMPLLRGIKIYPDNPFKFDFIIDQGGNDFTPQQLKTETDKLVRYFLAGLTIPEKDLWVNLSPYEQNRIVPQELGQTDLGKDMLGLDYVLKQLAASLTYPETEQGKKYWNTINGVGSRPASTFTQGRAGPAPTNLFNKVWITPESATIYQDKNKAFITDSKLKVMMEKENPAFMQNILPLIETEVNHGERFAQLRQIYHSLLLASWFKNNLKTSIINQLYSNQKKISGVDVSDPKIKEKIYQQYCEAFKKGAYNYIKSECGDASLAPGVIGKRSVPIFGTKITRRHYFSGGMDFAQGSKVVAEGLREGAPSKSTFKRFAKRALIASAVLGVTAGAAYKALISPKIHYYQFNRTQMEKFQGTQGLTEKEKRNRLTFTFKTDVVKADRAQREYNSSLIYSREYIGSLIGRVKGSVINEHGAEDVDQSPLVKRGIVKSGQWGRQMLMDLSEEEVEFLIKIVDAQKVPELLKFINRSKDQRAATIKRALGYLERVKNDRSLVFMAEKSTAEENEFMAHIRGIPRDIVKDCWESARAHNLPASLLLASLIATQQGGFTLDYSLTKGIDVLRKRGAVSDGVADSAISLMKKTGLDESVEFSPQTADFLAGVVASGKATIGVMQVRPAWVREYRGWARFGVDAEKLSDREISWILYDAKFNIEAYAAMWEAVINETEQIIRDARKGVVPTISARHIKESGTTELALGENPPLTTSFYRRLPLEELGVKDRYMLGQFHPVRYHKMRPCIDLQEYVMRSGVFDEFENPQAGVMAARADWNHLLDDYLRANALSSRIGPQFQERLWDLHRIGRGVIWLDPVNQYTRVQKASGETVNERVKIGDTAQDIQEGDMLLISRPDATGKLVPMPTRVVKDFRGRFVVTGSSDADNLKKGRLLLELLREAGFNSEEASVEARRFLDGAVLGEVVNNADNESNNNTKVLEKVDLLCTAHQENEVAFFMSKAKPATNTNIIFEDFARPTTLVDTIYTMEADEQTVIEGLQNKIIDTYDFEISALRIRGANRWFFIKGTKGAANGESISAHYRGKGFPYNIFDIIIHSHIHGEDDLFPVPSTSDMMVDLQRQLSNSWLYVRGKQGLTRYEAKRLTRSEFSLLDYVEVLDFFTGFESEIKNKAEQALGKPIDEEMTAVVDSSLREFYNAQWKPFIERGDITIEHLPWKDISLFKDQPMSLSQQLQSKNPDERLCALYRLFYLGLPNQLLLQVLASFSHDPDERIQIAILDWIEGKNPISKENIQAIIANFEQSQFPIVQALTMALRDRGKFTTLMDYDKFYRFFPKGSLSDLDKYRLRRALTFMNTEFSMIIAGTRISSHLAARADKAALEIFLKHLEEQIDVSNSTHPFVQAANVFHQRWGMDAGNNGGLDMDASKADIKFTGKADGLNLSNQNLSFDTKDFKGFTYSVTRLEKLQNSDVQF
jgi:hypothetical protein